MLGVSHFSKGTAGRTPTERVTGSLAFAALARIVMVVAKVEPKDGEPGKRIFARAKSNIGQDGGGFEYDLEQVEVPQHVGLFASQVRWGNAIEGSARDILAEAEAPRDEDGGAMADAKAFLRDYLSDGPKPANDVQAAARHAGLSGATLRRAKDALRVASLKAGMSGVWTWGLPEGAHENPKMLTQKTWASSENDEHLRDGGLVQDAGDGVEI